MAFKMDVGDYFAATSGFGTKEDPLSALNTPFGKMFGTARRNNQDFGELAKGIAGYGGMSGVGGSGIGGFEESTSGVESVLGNLAADRQAEMDFAAGALGSIAAKKSADEYREFMEEQARRDKKAQAKAAGNRMTGQIIGAVGGIGAAAVGALI